MNKNRPLFILTALLVISFNMTLVSTQNISDGFSRTFASSSGSANIVNEGDSTFLNSKQDATGKLNVSTVIVIPNPSSSPNSNKVSNERSSDGNESKQLNPSDRNTTLQYNKNTSVPSNITDMDEMKDRQKSNNSFNDTSLQNEIQRGEYLIDNNGVHYYNIDNCSLVRGSSGIGDMSECEDAEREIQEELTG